MAPGCVINPYTVDYTWVNIAFWREIYVYIYIYISFIPFYFLLQARYCQASSSPEIQRKISVTSQEEASHCLF